MYRFIATVEFILPNTLVFESDRRLLKLFLDKNASKFDKTMAV